MKTLIQAITVALSALLLFSCSSTKDAAADADKLKGSAAPLTSTVKILSINLAHSLQDKTDVKLFADWVKTTGAEVVAVQQITRPRESQQGFDSYGELLKRLDMRGTFAKARYFQGWDSGNALLSMYPLLQSNTYPLPVGKGKVRRSLSFGVFELGLKPVAFASTDLDDSDNDERLKQVREIFSIQKSVEEFPIIVTGNFGERATGQSSAAMAVQYQASHSTSDQLSVVTQHVYVPLQKKMTILSAEKVVYKPFNQNGVIVTVQIEQ
jgi:endonuclease/exonuclease/phosphatase family metal-dependent hydrolase